MQNAGNNSTPFHYYTPRLHQVLVANIRCTEIMNHFFLAYCNNVTPFLPCSCIRSWWPTSAALRSRTGTALPGHNPLPCPLEKATNIHPPHPTLRQVMVANIRCAEIKDDQLRNLTNDQAWQRLSEQAASGAVVPGFGSAAFALTDSCTKG